MKNNTLAPSVELIKTKTSFLDVSEALATDSLLENSETRAPTRLDFPLPGSSRQRAEIGHAILWAMGQRKATGIDAIHALSEAWDTINDWTPHLVERAAGMMRAQLRRLEFDDVEWLALLLSSLDEE